ncbi:hypothetical protein OKW21_000200 [Catalinimonas alkaloidigena]|nr:hypothetical protein [Catalinimonas alkaloidigena]
MIIDSAISNKSGIPEKAKDSLVSILKDSIYFQQVYT